MLAAFGAGDMVSLYEIEHLLVSHAVRVGFGIELIDKIIRAEAHLALLAVEQGIGEAGYMTARFPNPGMHEDIGVDFKAVMTLLNEALAPGLLDVVLEPCAKRAVIPCVGETAVDFRPSENVAPVFTQSYDFIHC